MLDSNVGGGHFVLVDYCETFYFIIIEFTQHFLRTVGAIVFDPLIPCNIHTVYRIECLT